MTRRSEHCKKIRHLIWDKYTFFLPGHKQLTDEQMVCQEYLFTLTKALGLDKYMLTTSAIPDDL